MVETIPEFLLARLSEFVAAKMGLHFPPERWGDLEKNIRPVVAKLGFHNVASGIQRLLSSELTPREMEILADHLTVGETYFFREKQAFEFLKERIVPEWLENRRKAAEKRVRIWSAGCCSGEEPYSLAIFLSKAISNWKEWNITILATDINPRFLRKASQGIYGEWSFRGTPPWVKTCCFKKLDRDRYEILPEFKQLVTFAYLNLAEDIYPSLPNNTNAMDLIFCRNVLMYFAEGQAQKVVGQFHSALVNGGYLVVSATESSPGLYRPFVPVHLAGFTFYKKTEQRTAEAQPVFRRQMIPSPGRVETFSPAPIAPELPATREIAPPAKRSVYEEALVLYEAGRYSEATEKLLNLEEISDAKHGVLLARAFANQGKLGESLEWCDKAIAVKKMNPESHYLRAVILQEQGRMEESIATLKRALYLDPEFVLAHFALGNLALRRAEAEQAIKHFENALSLLNRFSPETILPGSEGLTSARLSEIIRATMRQEKSS